MITLSVKVTTWESDVFFSMRYLNSFQYPREKILFSHEGVSTRGELPGFVPSVFLPWRCLYLKMIVGLVVAIFTGGVRQKAEGQRAILFRMPEDRDKIRRMEGRKGKRNESTPLSLPCYLATFGTTHFWFPHLWGNHSSSYWQLNSNWYILTFFRLILNLTFD